MSRFDEIREAAITKLVEKDKRLFVSRMLDTVSTLSYVAIDNPLGQFTEQCLQSIKEIENTAHVNFRKRAEDFVDSKLLNFLTQDERDKEDSLKKEFPLKSSILGVGIARTGQAYNKETAG